MGFVLATAPKAPGSPHTRTARRCTTDAADAAATPAELPTGLPGGRRSLPDPTTLRQRGHCLCGKKSHACLVAQRDERVLQNQAVAKLNITLALFDDMRECTELRMR